MRTATLVAHLHDGLGTRDARLYLLSEPLEGHRVVMVSRARLENGLGRWMYETYIFAADPKTWEVTNWSELPGSTRGDDEDHTTVLTGLGYTVG